VVFKFVGFCDHVTTSANNNRQNFALWYELYLSKMSVGIRNWVLDVSFTCK
jgi:hypothetical protein